MAGPAKKLTERHAAIAAIRFHLSIIA